MAHEIGHLFGMKHCTFYNCLLNGCNSFEEFDSKPIYMCPVCLRKLQSNIEFGFLEQYEALDEVLQEIGGDLGEFSAFYSKAIERIKSAYGNHY
jgi:archaemetzincin